VGSARLSPRPARARAHEEREILFILGYWENPVAEKFDPPGSQVINKRTVRPVIDHWLQSGNVEAGLRGLRERWTSCSPCEREDPGRARQPHGERLERLPVHGHLHLSRSASFYESGIGRGMGFRDSNQDLLGFVQMIPERARQRILDIAATQLPTEARTTSTSR